MRCPLVPGDVEAETRKYTHYAYSTLHKGASCGIDVITSCNVPPRVNSLIPVPRAPHTLTMCKLVVDNYVTQKILLEIALVSVQ